MVNNSTLVKQTLVGMIQVHSRNGLPAHDLYRSFYEYHMFIKEKNYISSDQYRKVLNEALKEAG